METLVPEDHHHLFLFSPLFDLHLFSLSLSSLYSLSIYLFNGYSTVNCLLPIQRKQGVQQQTAQWLEQHHQKDQKTNTVYSRFDTLETQLFPSDPELESVSDSLRQELEKARQQEEVVRHCSQKENKTKKLSL